MFRENYVLAHAASEEQDIYEGGSKLVAILNADPEESSESLRQYLYTSCSLDSSMRFWISS